MNVYGDKTKGKRNGKSPSIRLPASHKRGADLICYRPALLRGINAGPRT